MNDWLSPDNPSFWWHCFLAYEGLGVLFFVLARQAVLWAQRKRKKSDIEVAIAETFPSEKLNPKGKFSWVQDYIKEFRRDPLVNILGPLAIMLLWPAGIVIAAMDIYDRKILDNFPDRFSSAPSDPDHKFHCKPEYLVRQVIPEEVEAESFIEDPLNRTPQKPFGHLFGAWQKFIASQGDGQKMWLFEVPGVRWSGPMKGYAWVSEGFGKKKVKAEFIFEWS